MSAVTPIAPGSSECAAKGQFQTQALQKKGRAEPTFAQQKKWSRSQPDNAAVL
jgi:hypothetical protein